MTHRCVTILGGTGFVGTQLTCLLASEFDEIRLLTRHAQRVRTVRVLPNVHLHTVNVHDAKELQTAIEGSDTVINLVGILNQGGSQNSFHKAHVGITQNVLDACKLTGVSRYLHMSSLGADLNGTSEYLRTKGEAEKLVKSAANLDWTIFRPSVIFGEDDSFFNRFVGLVRALPVFPLACPDAKMAPVYVNDVCKAFAAALDSPATVGQSYNLCGPKEYTLRELVEFTASTAGLNRKVLGLPDWAAKLQARVMEWVPGKPFSRDNYLSLQTDSICSSEDCKQPTSIEAIVPRYIGTSDINGRLQARRRWARR
ncbi:MAG: complex I NDUFA9 subunit family protein [Gammaproteobacteria bacterium]|nr:complex I NDUFA9 subunit family protein [Gammaproteobacteria bacterium]